MSDRVNGFTVVLSKDYKDDDAELIGNAIRLIRGVCKVTPNIVTESDYFAEQRVKEELLEKLINIFNS